MAPRNILVDQRNITTRYIIIDFEKTISISDEKTYKEIDFWRGAVLSEEFSSMCSFDELYLIFGDKYNPKLWDFKNVDIMP